MAQKLTPPAGLPSSHPLRLGKGEVVHVGVDVHKHTYHVAVLSDVRGVVTTWVQPARPELLVQRRRPIPKQVAPVVYEAGPTGFALVRRLRDAGLNAEVIAPSKIPTLPGQQAKSDRLDGRKRATFAQKGLLRPVRVPTAQEEADRQVVRVREQWVRKSRAIQQQIKAFLLQHGVAEPAGLAHWSAAAIQALRALDLNPELRFCLDLMRDERQHAQDQLERATRKVSELAKAERHRDAAAVLQTVPGVGPITAMTFRTEWHEPGRFGDGGEVAQMVGRAPQVVPSGLTRRAGGLLTSGNARRRTVLVEAAWRWVAGDEVAARRYRPLAAATGSPKKAIVGMARRRAILLWRLSVRGEPYRSAA